MRTYIKIAVCVGLCLFSSLQDSEPFVLKREGKKVKTRALKEECYTALGDLVQELPCLIQEVAGVEVICISLLRKAVEENDYTMIEHADRATLEAIEKKMRWYEQQVHTMCQTIKELKLWVKGLHEGKSQPELVTQKK